MSLDFACEKKCLLMSGHAPLQRSHVLLCVALPVQEGASLSGNAPRDHQEHLEHQTAIHVGFPELLEALPEERAFLRAPRAQEESYVRVWALES